MVTPRSAVPGAVLLSSANGRSPPSSVVSTGWIATPSATPTSAPTSATTAVWIM
jgi:hypothetical protein